MVLNSIIVIVVLSGIALLFSKPIRTSNIWMATAIPLASIIGSGFLVSAPLLMMAVGEWALLAMLGVVIIAYAIGASIRYNISHVEVLLDHDNKKSFVCLLEKYSRPVLGVAYIISVVFYLKLMSSFSLYAIGLEDELYEKLFTSLTLIMLGIIGKCRGLYLLKKLEMYSVNIKLSIIFAILVASALYNVKLLMMGDWNIVQQPKEPLWLSVRQLLGLLIIVQGFETSRYINYAYKPNIRIKTMRYAQWISGGIYVAFVGLSMVMFNSIQSIDEKTVIDLCRVIAPLLPILLIIAAVISQFSAAIADIVGSGGLLEEATYHKIKVQNCYIVITMVALLITWLVNIYEIISLASKAFAAYYAIQILETLYLRWQKQRSLGIVFGYGALFLLMLCVILFGLPAE